MGNSVKSFDGLQSVVDVLFTHEEINYIHLKLFGLDSTNGYCLDWNKEKLKDVEMSIEAKLMIQEGY